MQPDDCVVTDDMYPLPYHEMLQMIAIRDAICGIVVGVVGVVGTPERDNGCTHSVMHKSWQTLDRRTRQRVAKLYAELFGSVFFVNTHMDDMPTCELVATLHRNLTDLDAQYNEIETWYLDECQCPQRTQDDRRSAYSEFCGEQRDIAVQYNTVVAQFCSDAECWWANASACFF